MDTNFTYVPAASHKILVTGISAPPPINGVLSIFADQVLYRYFDSISNTAFSIASLWLIIYLTSAIYIRFTFIPDIPGPFWAAYTRLWMSKTYASACLYKVFHETSIRYGRVSRIGPNKVLISDPEESIRILNAKSGYRRGPWYDAFKIDPARANIVSERHKPTHMHMRFQMAAGVSNKTTLKPFANDV
jgi:hypothetical protein